MDFIATNTTVRKCFRVASYLIRAVLVAMPFILIADIGWKTFFEELSLWGTACLVWGGMLGGIAYFLSHSPMVRFTDSHVMVEGPKGSEQIAWDQVMGARVLLYSGVSSLNPVRLKVKGRMRGLTFQANDRAKAHLRTRFGELGWGF